jgi:ABC-2 type transport system ATP-binding protein
LACAIHARDLTKNFGIFVAANGISFDVDQGEIFGFLDPNGAGKPTTIKMLCTFLLSTKGKTEVDGFDIVKDAES